MKNFVHLHTHSHYSLLDAAVTVESLVEKASQLEMPALALTDHGNLFGAIEFYKEAKKKGVKPIIGCEFYISNGPHKERAIPKGEKNYHHLVVLARNLLGYHNLLKLASLAYTDGFYYKPRVDKQLLREHSEGLLGLTACLGGEIPQSILKGDDERVLRVIHEYQEIFGKEYFFLELQNHGLEKQHQVNEALNGLSKKHHVPLIVTNDVHYLNQEDHESHDILLCIGTQSKVTDEKRKRYPGDQFYFKSYNEMLKIFPDHEEALDNTIRIADMCDLKLEFKSHLPNIDVPEGYNEDTYLHHLCREGLTKRYPDISPKTQKRLDYELSVICQMGYAGYFLIVWDFIKYAKSQDIAVGPGRGSAVGSLVAYTLGITNLDPLKYNLIFERFLNPERISMPDIDTDFEDEKRDQVINYVIERYGKEKVAGIITFGALKARGVIRDVGRVLNIPLNEVDRIAKLIPGGPGVKLKDAYETVPDLKALIDGSGNYQKLFDLAGRLEGINRHAGTHAAGIVIGSEDLSNLVPLYADSKTKSISTQFEGTYLEECGLLKMDFLGLRNLSVIQKCLELIETRTHEKLSIDHIPLDDEKVYKLLQSGASLGIFQLESSGMQEMMNNLKPEAFEDIIALNALYRPGPLNSGMAEEFIQRKRNPKKIIYQHPLLKGILEETYGVIVYQEQVMEIARAVGGFSMGKADELRKAMGKKLKDKMNSLRALFLEGAVKKNIDKGLAETLYDQMAEFGEYGFNKSHSAAYALITYQTAFLKANYPIEYMTALLSCDKDNTDKIVEYVAEAKNMGIEILPPSVNHSYTDFAIEDNKIRFGLSAIKNVGTTAVQSLIEARITHGTFESLYNLCEKVDLRVVNKKVLECLIKSGACDSFDLNRPSQNKLIDQALDYGQSVQADRNSNQISLFGEEETPTIKPLTVLSPEEDWSERERLAYEKEVLGFYLSGHPLGKYREKIARLNLNRISKLKDLKEGSHVAICGLVQDAQFRISKRGSEWGAVALEGLTGLCEVLLFNKCFSNAKTHLDIDSILFVRGKLESVEPKIKIIADKVIPIDEVDESHLQKPKETSQQGFYRTPKPPPKKTNGLNLVPKDQKVHIQIKEDYIDHNNVQELDQLKRFFKDHGGQSPIFIHFPPERGATQSLTVKAGEEFNVTATKGLLSEIAGFSCVERTWMN